MENYGKLRPFTDIKYCQCEDIRKILLVYTLTENPIHCYKCKGALDPEILKLNNEEIDAVASWNGVFSALYELWLDSGEYENWAKDQLLKKEGQVNRKGLELSGLLSQKWPTYYWWFHDEDDQMSLVCPNCNSEIDKGSRHGHGKCEKCHIVV